MRLVGRLAVEPDQPAADITDTVTAHLHEPGAPQPFIQSLPIAVFLIDDKCLLAFQRREGGERAGGLSEWQLGHRHR